MDAFARHQIFEDLRRHTTEVGAAFQRQTLVMKNKLTPFFNPFASLLFLFGAESTLSNRQCLRWPTIQTRRPSECLFFDSDACSALSSALPLLCSSSTLFVVLASSLDVPLAPHPFCVFLFCPAVCQCSLRRTLALFLLLLLLLRFLTHLAPRALVTVVLSWRRCRVQVRNPALAPVPRRVGGEGRLLPRKSQGQDKNGCMTLARPRTGSWKGVYTAFEARRKIADARFAPVMLLLVPGRRLFFPGGEGDVVPTAHEEHATENAGGAGAPPGHLQQNDPA